MIKNQVVAISDIHIGTGVPTVWYQPAVHDPYLSAILNWVLTTSDSIQELILLGDIFDFWTYPPDAKPPPLNDIIKANPAILGKNGLLHKVVTKLNGAVTLMLGNHDGLISDEEFKDLQSQIGPVKLGAPVLTLTGSGGLRTTFAHGHAWTMFNAPDSHSPKPSGWKSLPVGHFVTRAFAYQMSQTLKPGQTVADLPNQGAPNGLDLYTFLKSIEPPFSTDLVTLLLNYVSKVTGLDQNASIKMADGSVTSIKQAKQVYADLFTWWAEELGSAWQASRAALADQWGDHLAWFAQQLAMQTNSDLVVFGHTHTPIGGIAPSPVNYVNSGFECPSLPDMPPKEPTFTVVDLNTVSAQIFQVRKQQEQYVIENCPAPIITPIVKPGMDYSCYCTIENQSSDDLTLIKPVPEPTRGWWAVPPIDDVPAGSRRRFWLQDNPGPYGSEGKFSYNQGGKRLDFALNCPTGPHCNTVSSPVGDFCAKSGSGGWQYRSVPCWHHPLQVWFQVK